MKVIIITGSSGLIGSESVKFFIKKGFKVLGIDNNLRKYFFGKDGDTKWQLNNLKPRTAKTKQKNEIKGSTKKIVPQKGSGGARHASRKAPIFVGGGVAHGPKGENNYKQKKLNKSSQSMTNIFWIPLPSKLQNTEGGNF